METPTEVVNTVGKNLSEEKCKEILANWRYDIIQEKKREALYFMAMFKTTNFVSEEDRKNPDFMRGVDEAFKFLKIMVL